MKLLSFKVRLLLAFYAVAMVGLCLPALVFRHQLYQAVAADAEQRVARDLAFIGWSLDQFQPLAGAGAEDLDRWCKSVAGQLGCRITYIAEGGRVLADSHVPWDQIALLDNHWNRPEVQQALAAGAGGSVRTSHTVHRDLIYAAVPVAGRGELPQGVLRIAAPASTLKERLNQLMFRFWAVVLAALIAAGLVGYWLAQRFEAPIQRLIEAAQRIGRGDCTQLQALHASPELERLARSIQQMAARIHQQMQRLDAEKSRLETIIDHMQAGVLLLDRNGKIDRGNRFIHRLQTDPKPKTGLSLLEVFLSNELQQACDRIIAGSDSEGLELKLGEQRFYDVSLAAVRSAAGLDGVVVVLHDVSEFKRLERVRRDFVANVSHELRTPLTAIKGYAETLLATGCAQDPEANGFISTILRKADHMARMVNDLLQLTRLEHQGQATRLGPVDALGALAAALETCRPMARDKDIHIQAQTPMDRVEVLAERDGLVQVFQNLLHNAIRYSPPATTITVMVEDRGERVAFGVADQGPGIAKAHQNRVFERFYRIDRQRESVSGSTGLGLAICRHLVENFGGRIWIQSPLPGSTSGTVFHFELLKKTA